MGIATQTSDGLKFSTTYMYVKNSSGTTLVAISSGGSVGIGSQTPTNKLTINSGSQYTRGYLSQTADIHIANTSGSGSGAYAGALSFSSTDEANLQAASIAAIQTGSDQNQIGLTFNTQASEFGSTDLAEAVRIKHDGNIGIGTTDPGYLLDIDGHMRIRGQDTRWTNSTVYLRADTPFYFLAHSSGNAQRAHFKSIQVSTTYSGTPPDNGIMFFNDTTLTRTAAHTLTTNAKEFKIASDSGDGVLKVYGAGGSDDGRIELLNQSGATSEGFKIRYDNDVGDTYFDNMWAGGSDANPAIRFRTKTAGTAVNAMTISHGGSVGIGGDPVSVLTINMTGGSYGSDATSGFIISNTSSGRATQRIRTVNNNAAELFFDVNGAARWDFSCRNSGSDYKLNLYTQAGSPSYTAVSGPIMTWLQNGNVGIGTDTPAFSSGGSGLEIERTTATLRLQHAGSHASEIYQNTSAFNIADLSSGNIVFKISNAEKMRLNSTGLGIGVIAAPNSINSTKLDVRGSIYFDNNALIASMGGENSNVDHIWHDDGSYDGAGGAWNFVSDGGYKGAGNSRLYAGHVYMAGSGTNYFNGAITANSNLTLSGSLLGVSNSSLSQIGNIILDTNGEDLPVINHQLNNDLALMDAKGGTVTYGGLSSTPSNTANAFRSDSSFLDVTSSTISNSSNGFTITLESLPRTLTYSTRVGITFLHDGWRCSYVKIEVYRAGAWTQIREETSNTKATVYQFYNTSSSGITKIRYTLKNPATTSIRIVSLFAFNYNSSGNSGYFLSQAGGSVYGSVGIGTASPSQKLHVVGSSLVTGYTYIDDTARYFSAGGSGVRLQTAHGYIQFGPQNSSWAHIETDRGSFYFNTNLTVNNGIVQSYDEDLVLNGSATNSAAILFKSGGTEYMRMNSSGNLGIGTASPGCPLQIDSTDAQKIILSGATDPYIRFRSGSTNRAYIQWVESGTSLSFFNQAGDNFDFFTHDNSGPVSLRLKGSDGDVYGYVYAEENSTAHTVGFLDGDGTWAARHVKDTSWDFRINNQSHMFINSSGCVGIGTASPASRLDVKADIRVRDTDSDSTHVYLNSNGSEGVLRLYNGANWGFIARGTSNSPHIGAYSGGSLNIAGFTSSNGSSFNSALTTFDFANERVGIGTGSPSAKLHVAVDGTSEILLERTTNLAGMPSQIRIKTVGSEWALANNLAGSNKFSIRDVTNNSHVMVFDSSQRVGINTTSPSADLTIYGKQNLSGTIQCRNGYNSNAYGFWLKLMLNDNTTYWYPPDGATSGNWTKLTKRDGTETVLYGANVQTFVQTSSKTSNGTVVLDGAYGQCIDVDISNGVSITGFSYGSSLNGDMATNGAETIILILRYNGTASVTWTATDNYLSTGTQTIQWSGGTAPTLTQVAGKADIFAITHMNYATWFGSVVAQNVTYT